MLDSVGVVWSETGSLFHQAYLSGRSRADSTTRSSSRCQYEGWLRKFTIAPQIGAGQQVFQPAGTARFRDLRELVGRIPRFGGRNAIRTERMG